ncbi:MAG: hypothetical protein IT536_08315 [Hyphomicrobiales bacterium]|nr:hypothetical protein [Hyphomicrobiales bacterium]
MPNFIKDGETIRFTGSDARLSPLQRAIATGGTIAPSPTDAAAPVTDHKQGDVRSCIYDAYDAKLREAWKGGGK